MDQIDALKQKVASANEGLAAANRLSEQLEKKTQAIAMLKHEVKLREDLLKKAQSQLKDVQSNNTVKVDRYRGGKLRNFGKVSLLGVDSLWGDCTFILADLDS